MDKLTASDWLALYGSILATLIALANFLSWLLRGPKLSVTVFSPSEAGYSRAKTFLAIVSNSGSTAVVVQTLEVSFRTARWFWAREIGRAIFDESSTWKPSVKLVPIPDKPNNVRPEPNVLLPNEELRAPATATKDYVEKQHWIRVRAKRRNSKRWHVGWARPYLRDHEVGEAK